ncbi:MAG: penicillin-binding protein [Acidobacteriota bacterium]
MPTLWGPRPRGDHRRASTLISLFRALQSSISDLFDPADRSDLAFEGVWRAVVKRRALCALALIGLWAAVLEARLVRLQVFQHDALLAEAVAQQSSQIKLEALRGDIRDRNGKVLAYSVQADSIVADPSHVESAPKTAAALCAALRDCTPKDRQDLERKLSGKGQFTYIRRSRSLVPEQIVRVTALKLPGVYLNSDTRRYYPNAETGVHVLGYVGQDNSGQAGVEYSFNEAVKGAEGLAYIQVDARRQRLETRVEREPVVGATLELTIDTQLQFLVERELKAGVEANRARGGTAIVMDPYTGEILAMANYPTFNPNAVGRATDDQLRNRAIADVYEPGSTFKIVTASAALEGKIVTPWELIDTNPGSIRPYGRSRPIFDTHHYGVLPFEDVIIKSSNVGAVKVGLRTGAERMTRYVKLFGFGQLLAPDLPGGSRGLWNANNLSESGLASVSMGYQVSVTPLQMATAVSAVANGGLLMQPHVVRALVRNGVREVVAPKVLNRAIEADTAAMLVSMMEGVVDRGTATPAQIAGYPVAGKTGTAHRIVDGHYSQTDYNASFVGFVPSRRPKFTILVVIDTPRAGTYYGGTVSAPIFKRIAEGALQYAGVPSPVNPTPPVLVPREPAPTPMSPAIRVVRFDGPAAQVVPASGPTLMPDLRGISSRQALRDISGVGLTARVNGSGVVVRQSPEPGTPVEPGGWASIELQRVQPAAPPETRQ